jgi:hypothetical protein
MLWALALASGMGILLGLRLRALSVLIASAFLVVFCVAIILFADWALREAAAFIFGALVALQCGYLVGLLLSPRIFGLPSLAGPHHPTRPR